MSYWPSYNHCPTDRTHDNRLGHPSEKLSVDVPRANWRIVVFNEVIIPVIMAALFIIAYAFVKSRSSPQVNALLRIAIISLGPVVFNMAVLITCFFISLLFGSMLKSCCGKFGSVMAAVAHTFAIIGLIASFEFLWCKCRSLH